MKRDCLVSQEDDGKHIDVHESSDHIRLFFLPTHSLPARKPISSRRAAIRHPKDRCIILNLMGTMSKPVFFV